MGPVLIYKSRASGSLNFAPVAGFCAAPWVGAYTYFRGTRVHAELAAAVLRGSRRPRQRLRLGSSSPRGEVAECWRIFGRWPAGRGGDAFRSCPCLDPRRASIPVQHATGSAPPMVPSEVSRRALGVPSGGRLANAGPSSGCSAIRLLSLTAGRLWVFSYRYKHSGWGLGTTRPPSAENQNRSRASPGPGRPGGARGRAMNWTLASGPWPGLAPRAPGSESPGPGKPPELLFSCSRIVGRLAVQRRCIASFRSFSPPHAPARPRGS